MLRGVYSIRGDYNMAKCDLCGSENAMLYPLPILVSRHLCKTCINQIKTMEV